MMVRRTVVVALSLVAALLALAGIAVASSLSFGSATVEATDDGPVDPQQGGGCVRNDADLRVGGSGGSPLLGLSDTDLDRELAAAKAAGMFSVRVDVDWSHVEAVQGVLNWENTDRVVDAILAHGMCPLAVIGFAPGWAQNPADQPSDSHFRPSSAEAFAGFTAAAASHYQDRIYLWEVWNEPNIVVFFKPWPSVDDYAGLLAAAYPAIKSANPNAFVLAGGLAPGVNNGMDIAPVTFLTRMYQLGANKHFDAFAMHPYTYPALPNDPDTADWSAAQQMWTMRDVMIAGGDSDKQIWVTEFGAPTGTDPTAVSDDVQAQSYAIVLNAARTESWIGPVYAYSLRDSGTDLADREQNFGLLHHDFSEKPAYGVVRSAVGD